VRTEDGYRTTRMLTINADSHPIMNKMHKPGEEKRMVVMLDPEDYECWLHSTPTEAAGWMNRTQRSG
jgi:putative SOS response-associated peptidase YedK